MANRRNIIVQNEIRIRKMFLNFFGALQIHTLNVQNVQLEKCRKKIEFLYKIIDMLYNFGYIT
jgi:hypothetical protein